MWKKGFDYEFDTSKNIKLPTDFLNMIFGPKSKKFYEDFASVSLLLYSIWGRNEGTLLHYNGIPSRLKTIIEQSKTIKEKLILYKPKTILEIGTACGHFDLLVKTLSPKLKIITVDKFDNSRKPIDILNMRFKDSISFFNIDTTSKDVAELYKFYRMIDMAWVDGSHKADDCFRDLELCMYIHVDVILVDDYNICTDVKKGVNKFLKSYSSYFLEGISSDDRGIAILLRGRR